MGLFDGLGGATSGGEPLLPTPDPAAALRPLDEATWARMAHDYHHGRTAGETTHVLPLDKHFKWMAGYCNVWTGWPGDGKTEFIYQLLLLRAVFKGKKSAIFSAENMPEEQIYDGLIHSLTGQNPDRRWEGHLPFTRYQLAKDFVREHFIVVYPGKGMGRTPQHLLSYFEAAIAKYGVSHCLLDPWNKADHSAMNGLGGIEPYLVNVLGQLTDWTVETKQSLTITAHPKRLDGMRHGQARPIPDGTSISGGQTWENMAHVVGTVYRPYKHEGASSDLYSQVAIYLHKVKSHKLVGFPGSIGIDTEHPEILVDFDWKANRYLFNNVSPLDCREAYAYYLTDAELNAHHAVPAAALGPRPGHHHARPRLPAPATAHRQPQQLRSPCPTHRRTARGLASIGPQHQLTLNHLCPRCRFLSMTPDPYPATVVQVKATPTHRLTSTGFAPVPLAEAFALFAQPAC